MTIRILSATKQSRAYLRIVQVMGQVLIELVRLIKSMIYDFLGKLLLE